MMTRVIGCVLAAVLVGGCMEQTPGGPAELASSPSDAAVSVPLNFRTHLTGDEEVPVRATQAQGQAIFQLSKDGTALSYRLIAANIENAFMAHIHMAPAGSNGGIVVWLYPSTAATPGALNSGRHNINVDGVITAANLMGGLAGRSVADLVAAIEAGTAYVNVHTSDGVDPANTGPGDFPGGEIRGQI
jgi:hypothetical protein